MYTLRIFLDGLIAFVPSLDMRSMTALMVDATDANSICPDKKKPEEYKDHQGYFLYRGKNYQAGDDENRRGDWGACRYWVLNYEHLSFQRLDRSGNPVPAGTLNLSIPNSYHTRSLPQQAEPADLGWIPKMGDVHVGGKGEADPGLLGWPDNTRKAIARIVLTEDRMSLQGFAAETPQGRVYPYRFRKGTSILRKPRALTELALVEIDFEHAIQLEARDLKTGQVTNRVSLTPARGESVVEVRFRNVPDLKECFETISDKRDASNFALVYALCKEAPDCKDRIYPDRINASMKYGGSVLEPEYCDPNCKDDEIPAERRRYQAPELCPFVQFSAVSPPQEDQLKKLTQT